MNEQPITVLKGVGAKTEALFAKLGIHTLEELLNDYPRTYNSYEKVCTVAESRESAGLPLAVCARLVKLPDMVTVSGMKMTTLTLREGGVSLRLVWYRLPYIRALLRVGETYVFVGKIEKKRGSLVMEQPELFSFTEYQKLLTSLQPVYAQTKGLGNKSIIKLMRQALEQRERREEYLPRELRQKYSLLEYEEALEGIHFPENREQLLLSRRRLVFDEFFFFLLAVRSLKQGKEEEESAYRILPSKEAESLESHLPYALTEAQKNAMEEIRGDMASGRTMNRLIQGDVGSGKTILAVLALTEAAASGYQGVLMAPTEVLARQHFESIQALFATAGIQKKVQLLTGSMTAKEKKLARERIASQEADIVIGTHALIQEKVQYAKLALVVIDEQHRFGVAQRAVFGEKGSKPHVMVMSATPIPRTLALILYGDLDISVLRERPKGRQSIKNCVVGTEYRGRSYAFLEKELTAGHQIYVICPLVEETEEMEAENVLDYTKKLRQELPTSVRVEYLHGRMKAKDKNRVMEEFVAGKIQVLVSTTVIEVGVNVPNATVMLIENAERFGLAQLHQLRGRVGRGNAQSYCIMIHNSKNPETQKRLDILNRSNDGFWIAEEDLKLRGAGDLFGERQSGEMQFQLADVFCDAELLGQVSGEVDALLSEDGGIFLKKYEILRKHLDEYLKKSYDKLWL
ncbi:MAG: ATP-dependent DNA helicase RecG [bacterium]|nr:ATP-dependent DNA helicase RecG [bacterium]